jgi:molybdenum cofactor cytidylyltransferase
VRGGRYSAIVLAAGTSTRMDRFKPLLPVAGRTMTDRVISIFRENGVAVTLVTGWRREELMAGIKTKDITVAFNPDFQEGMFTSVRAGLGTLGPDCRAFFIMPVDIPLVRPFTIRRLLGAAAEQPGMILYPVFGGERGHPPLVPTGLVTAILNWRRDGNLKEVLDAHESIAGEVSVPDENVLFDVDAPEDYDKLLERLPRYEIPTEKECEVILKDVARVSPELLRHSLKVAEVATTVARSLLESGLKPDIEAVRAAAVLHDIAKGRPGHAAAGAAMLREMGFGKIGEIVAVHAELPEAGPTLTLESKIVYLADKYVEGEKLVSLEERFAGSLRRFGRDAGAWSNIEKRRERALALEAEIEAVLPGKIRDIIG